MQRLRRLIAGAGPSRSTEPRTLITILALLTVLGLIPILIVGVGPVVISTAALAALWLLARRYGVIPR